MMQHAIWVQLPRLSPQAVCVMPTSPSPHVTGLGGDHFLLLHLTAQWVNVPKAVVEDLIAQSQGAILSNLDGLIISNGSVAIPRSSIQATFEVIDECLTGIPFVPSDSTDSQVRGLGSMVAFWERMRNICPKVNLYNGPILQSNGSQRMTSDDLDKAMLATRGFWFEEPISSHHHWDDILDVYKLGQE